MNRPPHHELKTDLEEWVAIDTEKKTADIRRNDRNYRPGDLLMFRCWDPDARTVDPNTQVETLGAYCGAQCWRRISHVMIGGRYGLADGYVLLSFSRHRLHPPTPRASTGIASTKSMLNATDTTITFDSATVNSDGMWTDSYV